MRAEHDVPYVWGTAEKYHQWDRQWNSWAQSGLDNASDREKQPVPGGREVGSWQLFIFLRGERGTVKTKIHLQFLLANSHLTIHIASLHYWLNLQNSGFHVFFRSVQQRHLYLPLLSSSLCWTVIPLREQMPHQQVYSVIWVLVMHVNSKAFFFIRVQLALVLHQPN